MRYTPLESELSAINSMSAAERLHYATSRMFESEEVWSLGDENGWIIGDRDGRQAIPLWPYRQLVLEHCREAAESPLPQATSLEHFVYGVLGKCESENIHLEIFPTTDDAGILLSSSDLYEILNGLMESSAYVLEG